jgi:hypothetical protein
MGGKGLMLELFGRMLKREKCDDVDVSHRRNLR